MSNEPGRNSHPWPVTLLALLSVGVAIFQFFSEDVIARVPIWILAIVGIGSATVTFGFLLRTKSRADPPPELDPSERLRRRITAVDQAFQEANAAFGEAGELADELRRELAAQHTAHKQLSEEAERQRVLINMDREEAEAVQALIIGSTQADKKRQRIREWSFFLAGLLLAIPINILSDLIGPK